MTHALSPKIAGLYALDRGTDGGRSFAELRARMLPGFAWSAQPPSCPQPLVGKLYLGLLKTYTLTHTFWVLHHPNTCQASSRRAPVAVMGTILGL